MQQIREGDLECVVAPALGLPCLLACRLLARVHPRTTTTRMSRQMLLQMQPAQDRPNPGRAGGGVSPRSSPCRQPVVAYPRDLSLVGLDGLASWMGSVRRLPTSVH